MKTLFELVYYLPYVCGRAIFRKIQSQLRKEVDLLEIFNLELFGVQILVSILLELV
jgi:hypothetical protein